MNMRLLIGLLFLTISCNQKTTDGGQSQARDSVDTTAKIDEILDTLTLTEFDKLFEHEELVEYDISTNSDIQIGLNKERDFWTSKRVLIDDTLRKLEIQGFPISLRQLDRNIRRIT